MKGTPGVRWGDSEMVQASCEVGGLGERRATAGAAPPAAAAARRGACMEAGRLNEMNTTWRRARSAVSGTSEIHILACILGPTRSYDSSHIDEGEHQVHEL